MTTARFSPIGFDKSKLLACMTEEGIDAVLLSSPENVYYTTGYPSIPSAGNPILYALHNQIPFYSFIEADGRVTLLAWFGAVMGGVEFDVDHVELFADKRGGQEVLKNFFIGRNLTGKTIGIESFSPFMVVQMIEKHSRPAKFVVIDSILDTLRAVKSEREIELMKQSTAIVEKTMIELIENLKPGIRRPELIQEAKYRMIKNGASGVGHVTISFGGSNPEVEIDETLKPGKLVVLDIGANYKGYVSDIRRHAYTGPIPEELENLHRRMCGIVDDVSSICIPGKTAKEIYDYAVKLYEENGLIPLIVNVGHTIGLQTEEIWISNTEDLVLEPGMVINIELYTDYEPTGEDIGDEETYLITENGPVQITSLPRGIKSIEGGI
ncbi:MAG: aminopeptidase P family protein [Deltaproteobacteria bacterium]|nr:aminopeptidase P family protein [Deltaproteobacteria bacterium]